MSLIFLKNVGTVTHELLFQVISLILISV